LRATTPPSRSSRLPPDLAFREDRRRRTREIKSDRRLTPMPPTPEEPSLVLAELERVRSSVAAAQSDMLAAWHSESRLDRYAASAANLAAYIALRRLDLTDLQPRLAALGLSSLGRCEGHVLATLDAVIDALRRMCRRRVDRNPGASRAEIATAPALLRQATDRLLGAPPHPRRTRFMVTLPAEAAHDARFVDALIEHGMDCARINAAHDTVEVWSAMARQVKRAAAHQGRLVKILVDLPGPKLRTGPMAPGDPVIHLRVKRSARGELMAPGRLILDGSGKPGSAGARDSIRDESLPRLSLPSAWVAALRGSDTISFRDLRGRKRNLRVLRRLDAGQVIVEFDQGAYIAPGMRFERRSRTGARARGVVGSFVAPPVNVRVMAGDHLLLSPNADAGQPEKRRADGRLTAPAVVGCIEPSVFQYLEPGHTVKIDDGKVSATVERVDRRGALLKIVHAPPRGAKLGADKGLNFPDTRLPAHDLDHRDQAALRFAAEHADIVGYSFVQSGAEMDALHRSLAALTRRKLGVIAKIETATALENLPGIIVHGAANGPFGVMIARGDLAVEVGFGRLAEVQEEILWLCEAAHIPVIWATQVLDGLAKKGVPSRAEVTDAAMSRRAEGVMLNKGPYIVEAIEALTSILDRMGGHVEKKRSLLRPLTSFDISPH